jgi:hypothetical protein
MIERCEHSASEKFTVIRRALAQDKRLSFQARGLLVYVLSKPPKWKAKDIDLMREGGIKKHAYGSIMAELKTYGYATRLRERQEDGTFAWVLKIFEKPELTRKDPLPDFPVVDEPSMENQVVDNKSTCVRAGSSVDLKRFKEKEPLFAISDLRSPDSIPGLRNQLAIYENVPFEDGYAGWFGKYFPKGGIGRAPGSKCTLAQYAAHIESYFRTWNRNASSHNGNGHGGAVNDQPMKTIQERMRLGLL